MKFINFEYNNLKKLGILLSEKIVPIGIIASSLDMPSPKDMNDLIDTWNEETLYRVKNALDTMDIEKVSLSLSRVKVLPPIEYPRRNLFCLGKNYIDHAEETRDLPGGDIDIPEYPIYFTKLGHPCIGHNDMILNHKELTEKVDYEVELAVIIGKDGINISYDDAEEYIFGYTIVNDVSARNIQRKHGQWFKGKSLDTFTPMGPVIVHKSDIPFPVELKIKCSINGELRQNSNTRKLIFDIPSIISDLSKGMHLRKGDIITTGTPAGVGLGFDPFKFLKSGDLIDCYIENIGILSNIFE